MQAVNRSQGLTPGVAGASSHVPSSPARRGLPEDGPGTATCDAVPAERRLSISRRKEPARQTVSLPPFSTFGQFRNTK